MMGKTVFYRAPPPSTALQVWCPKCRAAPGLRCMAKNGIPKLLPHNAREKRSKSMP